MKFIVSVLLVASLAVAHGASVDDSIQVFVKTITGKTLIIRSKPTETIGEFKLKIQDKEGVPSNEQNLVFAGKRLEDDKTLADYNIAGDSTVTPTVRLAGGAGDGDGAGDSSNSGQENDETKIKEPVNKYFGVDREDKEAVEKRIRELSDEKFKELFGDDVNVEDLHFHHSHDEAHEKEPSFFTEFKQKFHEYAKQRTVKDAISWLFGLFKKPQDGEQK